MKNDNTILIVEDTISCQTSLAALLRKVGYRPICAGNGIEAMQVLENQTPRAMLLDIDMPQMNGISLLRLMRSQSSWKNIPIIVLSALSDQATVAAAVKLGVKDYIAKGNFRISDLLERLNRYVSQPVSAPILIPQESRMTSNPSPDLVDIAGDFEAPPLA